MWSFEQDQEPEEASEQITIVPDIVDMSDNYENIKVTRIRLNQGWGAGKFFAGSGSWLFFQAAPAPAPDFFS